MTIFAKHYHDQVSLLLLTMLQVSQETCFSLKGGTAINLFLHDLPRLSIDIDLAFIPILSREDTINEINQALNRVVNSIKIKKSSVVAKLIKDEADHAIGKIIVQKENVLIKIETNSIFRGFVFKPIKQELCPSAQEIYKAYLEISMVSIPDLYAGKLCAMLNRQHPRDLFDVKLLLEKIGITNEIKQAFLVYLCSDRRPIHELLSPNIKNQENLFNQELVGMLKEAVSYAEFESVIPEVLTILKKQITQNEKQFILSLASGEPEWKRLNIPHISELPALQWKLLNIRKMDDKKRKKSVLAIEEFFQ